MPVWKRAESKSSVQENRTQGIVAGAPGSGRSCPHKNILISIFVVAVICTAIGCKSKTVSVKTTTPTVSTDTIKSRELRFDFPDDYKNWTHAVSKVILDKASPLYGFQQVFVNDTGLAAYKKGSGYPDGSMIVVGFYEAIEGNDDINQGDIIWYAAMKRDLRASKTGGWIFDGFDGKTLKSKVDNPMTGCFVCHMGQKKRDYVFTQFAGEITSLGEPVNTAEGRYDFPADLRSWRHSNSKVILDKSSPLYGMQQIYVNDKGIGAHKAGEKYPDDSHITIGFYEPIKDGDSITQGKIIWYASMKKDSNNAKKTGGWLMDGFDGKTLQSKVDNPLSGCFICHMGQKENDYVFSKYIP